MRELPGLMDWIGKEKNHAAAAAFSVLTTLPDA
jgi:hypothetical protein